MHPGRLRPLATPGGEDGAVTLHPGRHAWVQVARGAVEIGGERLQAGDGVAISERPAVELRGLDEAEVLLFDLA